MQRKQHRNGREPHHQHRRGSRLREPKARQSLDLIIFMGHYGLPDDEAIGNAFLYWFRGATLEWWAWDDSEVHVAREMRLRSWLTGGG